MECKIFKQEWLPEEIIYFELHESDGVVFLNAYNTQGKYLATILSVDENGAHLAHGIPPNIGLPTDNTGRIMLINRDLKEIQKITKRDLPLERIE